MKKEKNDFKNYLLRLVIEITKNTLASEIYIIDF